jgi:hypothetical protein
LVIFDVPFSIRCNSTTIPAIDAKSIALERSLSLFSNDILDIVVIVLQRKVMGCEKVKLRLDFDLQFSSFTLSGVSVNTVHYAGSNNTHTEQKYIDRQKYVTFSQYFWNIPWFTLIFMCQSGSDPVQRTSSAAVHEMLSWISTCVPVRSSKS